MGFIELFLIAIGLSADAFAVAICTGLGIKKINIKKSLIIGLYFGIFQAGMPVIGYFLAMWFSDRIVRFGPYIAFVLLLFLGTKMILSSRKKDDCSCGCCENCSSVEDVRLTPTKMLPLAVATSIDALAVGVSFALLRINITLAVSLIGIVTLTLSTIGAKIGSFFGTKFKSKAEAIGGLILIGMGLKILIDHLIN